MPSIKWHAAFRSSGWRQPLVVEEQGIIIVGHCRLLAARKLNLATVPVHIATDLTPAQVKAYRLMDNRSQDEAQWDYEMLGAELLDLKELDVDLGMTGFDQFEIDPHSRRRVATRRDRGRRHLRNLREFLKKIWLWPTAKPIPT